MHIQSCVMVFTYLEDTVNNWCEADIVDVSAQKVTRVTRSRGVTVTKALRVFWSDLDFINVISWSLAMTSCWFTKSVAVVVDTLGFVSAYMYTRKATCIAACII